MLVSTGNGGGLHNNLLALKCYSVSLLFLGGSMLVDPTLAFYRHDKHPLCASSSEFSFFDYIPIWRQVQLWA